MRIAVVAPGGALSASPETTGGVESYVHFISEALTDLGNEVIVYDLQSERRIRSRYLLQQVPSLIRWNRFPFRPLNSMAFGVVVSTHLRQLIKRQMIDGVVLNCHFALPSLLPLIRDSNVQFVYVNHNPIWSHAPNLRSSRVRLEFFLEIQAMRAATYVVAMSEATASNLATRLAIDPHKFIAIPPGIDDSWFNLMSTSGEQDGLIVSVGRIAPYKNQELIVRAAPLVLKRHPGAKFVIIGEVSSTRYLKRLMDVRSNLGVGGSVEFIGKVSLPVLKHLVSLSSVFLLPSLQENLPQALLQAMAAGKACVVSDIPPFRELCKDNMLMVRRDDAIGLANAINLLLDDQFFRRRLSEKARETSKGFTWTAAAEKIITRCFGR